MGAFKLTIRHGPKVTRESHPSLEEAIDAMRSHCERIRSEGGLDEVDLFRTYEPGDQVNARLEISSGGLFRSRDAGIDVMGDGGLVPFRGGVSRKPMAPTDGDTPYDAVVAALRG